MSQERRRYIIKTLKEPRKKGLEVDMEWVCRSLGFAGTRDKEKTAVRIFKLLLQAAKKGEGLTSDEIAEKIKPTRGAVVHHLNKFMRAGLIVKVSNDYELRMNCLKKTIEEIKLDAERAIMNIGRIAESIDKELGLEER
ncbi:MAG: ArsR family transcriptional regulator [Candidatus Woesearchaeota archaeon]